MNRHTKHPSGRGRALLLRLVALAAISVTGCSSSGGGGGGPNVTVTPQYQPTGQARAVAAAGKPLPVSVVVVDGRQTKGRMRPDGREVLAEGDKGKVYAQRPLTQALDEGLRAALTRAGFAVAADAPVVVEATLVDLPLVAYQFTHWNLPTERASTLDALAAVVPGPVRETSAKGAVNVVVRRRETRLGFAHTVSDAAAAKDTDSAVVQQTLSRVLSGVVDQAVAKVAPDIEIATRTPVTAREIDGRAEEIAQQVQLLRQLGDTLAAREATLAGDRAALEQMRRKIQEDREAVQTSVQADRSAADAERAKLQQERLVLTAQADALNRKLQELPNQQAAAAAAVRKQQQELAGRTAELDRRAADVERRLAAATAAGADAAARQKEVEARKKELQEREQNLAAYTAKLQEQAKANQALTAQLQQREQDLQARDAALQKWKQDVEARAEVRPPPAIVEPRKPLIVITDPAASFKETTLRSVTVSGVASDDRQVVSVRATVNGQPVDVQSSMMIEDGTRAVGVRARPAGRPATDKTVPPVPATGPRPATAPAGGPATRPGDFVAARRFLFEAELRDGSNEVVVEAVDDEDLKSVERLTFVHDKGKGRTFVISIGINDYVNRGMVPPLKYAVSDAEGVAAAFASLAGGPDDTRVTRVLNADASREKLVDFLFYQLPSQVRPADTVIIFFSGHGAPDTVTDAKGTVETFLLPIDANPAKLFSTAIRMSDVATMLRRITSERIVFLADTCYSGAAAAAVAGAGAKTVSMPGVALRAIGVRAVPARPEGKGCAIITATTGTEVAQERAEFGHGIFSYHVLEGLKGQADRNRDGSVTVNELYEHVRAQVGKTTGGSQTPQISRDQTAGDIVLSRVTK